MHGEEDCAVGDLLAALPFVLPDRATAGEAKEQQQVKRARVEALLSRLSPREQQIIRLRYGLDESDGRAHSLGAIAHRLGIDASTVCGMIGRALQKLRAPQETEEASLRSPQQQQAERRQEQVQRLKAACDELEAQGIPICVRTLARTSHVDKKVIGPIVRLYWNQQGSEQERLEAVCAELEAEGTPRDNGTAVQPGTCREQGCRRFLETLSPCRQAQSAFSQQGQTRPSCESVSPGPAASSL